MTDATNLLLLTDSYKVSHHKQYPLGTETVYSYFESRGGEFSETVFFGLQYILDAYLAGVVVTEDKIGAAEEIFARHFGNKSLFNRTGWQNLLDVHGGRLPVRIKAVPEGSVIPTSNVLMTIENTDPSCFWLTNYLETLLVHVWYPSTVATQSRTMKQEIASFLRETGTLDQLSLKLHDFGFRGATSVEAAGIGGAAHLVSFQGTDNLAGITHAQCYYHADMPGFSIPAAEHSTMTAWTREHEVDAFRNMLEQFPAGTVAVVSDSFDVYRACRSYWGEQLHDAVLQREGTLVVRPDSGDPPTVVVRVLEILGEKFGYSTNEKGYRVLDPHVRVLQGDAVDRVMLTKILSAMRDAKWSADNIAFGSGGGLLQKLNRDTCRFAFKCSSVTVHGRERDVFKEPVTDRAKSSKRGRLKLVRRDGVYHTVRQSASTEPDELVEVFLNGEVKIRHDWQQVCQRAARDLSSELS